MLALVALASAQVVLDLTEDSFDEAIKDKKVLVEFFAPWCGHCKQLAPQYDKAAAEIGTQGVLAKVDCTVEKDLCSKYGVRGYPTLKFFTNGNPIEYQKGRTAKDIVNFILEQNKDAVTNINSVQEAEAHNAGTAQVTVIGFFEGDVSEAYKTLADEQRMNGFSFGSSNDAAVAAHFGVTSFPAMVAFKKFDAPQVNFQGEFTVKDMTDFLDAESFPLVGEIGPDNYKKYVDRNYPLVYIFVDPSSEEQKAVVEAARATASAYKGKLSIVSIDGVQYKQHGESMGLKGTTPDIVIHDMAGKAKYLLPEGTAITEASLSAFLQDWADKKLTAHLKSQPIPETQAESVYTLVGKEFDRVARDVTKDVMVEFYAPWCGHCKELKPKYDKVGAHFASDSNIVIAAFDATENDAAGIDIEGTSRPRWGFASFLLWLLLFMSCLLLVVTVKVDVCPNFVCPTFSASGFPTIYFFPASADGKANPLTFNGDRTTDGMIKYINENRVSAPAAHAAKDEL